MSQFHTGLAVTVVLTTTALMTACTSWRQYDITVNEVTIYAPATPLRVDGIEDPALRDCLQQTATDTEAQGVADLINLNCSAAGITTLAGLAQFDQIRSLKLSGNTIRNLLQFLRNLSQICMKNFRSLADLPFFNKHYNCQKCGNGGIRYRHYSK